MKSNVYQYKILILDFGSQYTQLIARRVRDTGVYCEIFPWHASKNQIRAFNPHGIILSGGPNSSTKVDSPRASEYVFQSGVPVLGICYGMHIMSIQLGGQVRVSSDREFGYAQVFIQESCTLLDNIYDRLTKEGTPLLDVWMSHGDIVTVIPNNFKIIGSTNSCPCAIIANEIKHFYGIQFHPEVTHTHQGHVIFQRFILDICKCRKCWIPVMIIDDKIQNLKKQIGFDKVILALSGGVDSFVTALLLNRAIGKQLICIFVDNGLLRLNEAKQIMKVFKTFDLNIIKISAETRFLNALVGIHESELKRKIIGRVFVEIFEEEASKHTAVKWLAQGTIYTDVIESAVSKTCKSHLIKSHHNVGGLPKEMKLKLIEPLKYLFKDEVRKLGLELGLPYNILYRHPFPGPGLGVRIIGEVKKVYCDLLRQADAIFIEELYKENLYYQISQAFVVFLPLRSVSVMGDTRKYNWVISLRAVETVDFMTANWARLPYSFLARVSNRIINEIIGISRVVYDISGKPPATIEWE
ncbi:glutamine-hydrolyzing GMP synthase [Arsenophonus symbiont of Ornithomya chloropus]|uniref:glutamine-hydrolyzing GMP synthase n=1 Tax=Arsenophonus symbiont of Ornithomya chloropus TaxID=634121 RepID=UPI0032B22EC1